MGGVPPFSAKKKSVKDWPKNSVFKAKNSVFKAKNAVFGEKILDFGSVKGGGGVPPFSVKFFSLTLQKNLVR